MPSIFLTFVVLELNSSNIRRTGDISAYIVGLDKVLNLTIPKLIDTALQSRRNRKWVSCVVPWMMVIGSKYIGCIGLLAACLVLACVSYFTQAFTDRFSIHRSNEVVISYTGVLTFMDYMLVDQLLLVPQLVTHREQKQ
jgi:hypothetical protein